MDAEEEDDDDDEEDENEDESNGDQSGEIESMQHSDDVIGANDGEGTEDKENSVNTSASTEWRGSDDYLMTS